MTAKNDGSPGGRVALVLFGLLVGAITCIWSVQIIQQGFQPAASPPDEGCRSGVLRLVHAVRKARQSSAQTSGELAAVATFRAELASIWRTLEPLREICRDDRDALQALRRVEQLRYAEEHTLRYESRDVAAWRRALHQVERRWSEEPP